MSADPGPILDLIEAFRRSKTMFAAVSLSIFDRLENGPAPVGALCRHGEHEDSLERLLDACVSLKLLTKDGERYANTAAADAYLRRSSPKTMTGYILYSNEVLWKLWAHLEDGVREGGHRWKQVFGLEGGIFSHFYRTEEAKREFLLGMHGFGLISSPAVVRAFDLSGFRRMVDLGGGTGHLAMAAAEAYPAMEAAVFDLAGAIAFTGEFTEGTRVELLAGDFFRDDLPAADLYAVGRILHDWSEEKIKILLAKIYAALPAGGALLIAEKLMDDDLAGPVHAHMQSLNMLLCTEGRERSLTQYSALLREAGFGRVEGERTGTPLDVVLAMKVG
ncbi:MAG: homocysteine methyltransferase [Bryobacterales bacterium]|nr:homocysteine methyltransferase [Bryobacterales bacterium]